MILLTRPKVSALRKIKFLISVVDPGEGPSLFLDQTEARRAEKKNFETAPPPFSQGLDDLASPYPEGLDPLPNIAPRATRDSLNH